MSTSPDVFVGSLYGLIGREDRATLARLRRCLASHPGARPEVDQAFYERLPVDVRTPSAERPYWLTAGLFAFLAQGQIGSPKQPTNGAGDVGKALRQLAARRSSAGGSARDDALGQRLQALLRANNEDLDHQLRRTFGLLRGTPITPHWVTLIRHLGAWEHPDRWVQREWARSFWGGSALDREDPPTASQTLNEENLHVS